MNLTPEQKLLLSEHRQIRDRINCSSCNTPIYQANEGSLSENNLHITGKVCCLTLNCSLKDGSKWYTADSKKLDSRFTFADWYKDILMSGSTSDKPINFKASLLKELAKVANKLADIQIQLETLTPEQKALEAEYNRLVSLINIKEVTEDDILL